MEESILQSTKKILNILAGDTSFDLNLILHINAALGVIHQLGGPPIAIVDASATWDLLEFDQPMTALAQTIVFLRCRLIFDPPSTSFTIKALEDQIAQHEWRLSVAHEATAWTDPMPPKEPVDA